MIKIVYSYIQLLHINMLKFSYFFSLKFALLFFYFLFFMNIIFIYNDIKIYLKGEEMLLKIHQ